VARPQPREESERVVVIDDDDDDDDDDEEEGLNPRITCRIVIVRVSEIRMQTLESLELRDFCLIHQSLYDDQ
jgi:hypothetical protein